MAEHDHGAESAAAAGQQLALWARDVAWRGDRGLHEEEVVTCE